jgi:exodeoxyribonuclease VII large subunit
MVLHHMASQGIWTVSDLTRLIRESLETDFCDIWIEGEVSNIRMPGSGHIYFTLKDEHSQIRMILFRAGAQNLRFELKEGLHVLVRGRVSVYEPRGEYQVVVEYVEPRGIGSLQLAFEQLKERLAREGLFIENRKRPLPRFPRAVGIVTSPTGAAVRDMVTVLRRRWPAINIVIAPAPVQGLGAAERLASAIGDLSAAGLVDVIIVGRGGGSWEDLWCFNEEIVVRAIVASRVPVVTGVGHEIDVTLSDFAADYRAPTPSAAAEAVVPVFDEVMERVAQWSGRIIRCMRTHCLSHEHRVENALRLFEVMRRRLQTEAQRVDDLVAGVVKHTRHRLGYAQRTARAVQHELLTAGPGTTMREFRILLPQLVNRLGREMRAMLSCRRQLLHRHVTGLDALSPLAILSRGYSMVHRLPDGRLVKYATDVTKEDLIRVRLAAGRLLCVVQQSVPDSSP